MIKNRSPYPRHYTDMFGDWHTAQPAVDLDLQRSDPPRTRSTHPYSYDPFTIWGAPQAHAECTDTNWTDRLQEWDYAKYQVLAKKHYPDMSRPFDSYNCKGTLIEQFLRDWHADPDLKLLRVIEYCNAATGYPTWRLDIQQVKKAK